MRIHILYVGLCAAILTAITPSSCNATDVQISAIDDINLGSWSGGGSPVTGSDQVCIYRSAAGTYGVTATDDSTVTPGMLRLENAAHTVDVPYTLKWDSVPAASEQTLTDGVRETGVNPDSASFTCGGGTNARFSLSVDAADLQAVPAGVYTATISLFIEP